MGKNENRIGEEVVGGGLAEVGELEGEGSGYFWRTCGNEFVE